MRFRGWRPQKRPETGGRLPTGFWAAGLLSVRAVLLPGWDALLLLQGRKRSEAVRPLAQVPVPVPLQGAWRRRHRQRVLAEVSLLLVGRAAAGSRWLWPLMR
jgi:hypothetical protein